MPDEPTKPRAPQPKTEKCPHCGELFTKKGLDGHVAFKHGGARHGGASAPKAPAPAGGEGKPKPGAGAGTERPAGAAGRSDLDTFLYPNPDV